MPRYFIRLAFKGTAYSGWQVQDNAVSVQQKVHDALSVLLGEPIETTGCGRTDTGVHATRFYAHFDVSNAIVNPEKVLYSANAILPHDIVLKELFRVDDTAHARFDARRRTYEYFITTSKNPFLRELAHFEPVLPDMDLMNRACLHLPGTRDFSSFARTHGGTQNPICTVDEALWRKQDELLIFTISSNRFLRNMVRAVVGTLLEVGKGKLDPDAIPALLESTDRGKAGASAPACGLYLSAIEYPYIVFSGKGTIFDL